MFAPEYPPYDPIDKSGFSYQTVVKRWPIILTSVVDRLHRLNHDLIVDMKTQPGTAALSEKLEEGKEVIAKISGLKYQMGSNKDLAPIEEDGEADVEVYNSELRSLAEEGKNKWFTAPWLYAECYLYRLLRSYLGRTTHWKSYDPFFSQKQETLQGSSVAIYKIATTMHELEDQKDALVGDPDKLQILFKEMVQICLWGNATDLSLLTHLTPDDIAHLQTVGKEAQEARKEFILRDDQADVWAHLQSLKDQRVDFVLDNAGFELFTDLVFADFLVTYTPYVSKVVFHPKLFPWFVSDVTPPDFADIFDCLLSPSFFPNTAGNDSVSSDTAERINLKKVVTRWKAYLESGVFELSVPQGTQLGAKNPMADFWTDPWPYWDMRTRSGKLFEYLSGSSLVIFKGDLKLTGDVKWPVSTPFATALGPLAGSFPLLSLRTNKADVAVGINQAVADKLDGRGEDWRVSGKYALISYVPKLE
ncbi:DUF89 domain-containing protein [Athelia psychrophila]|uniref:Sugar phosphate phosphatase n=1 Tax=Athelia psychrophila TaxID=1759441 RepID=A0A166T1U8_9AGAM|nr:DUF89 domain-containing protein [Fibularhizoctonia sp. CBS 109695]